MKQTCALLKARLTNDGHLLSNLHFEILCIGKEREIWDEFYRCARELYNVDVFDNPNAPTARGIEPEYGFVDVYRIQYI